MENALEHQCMYLVYCESYDALVYLNPGATIKVNSAWMNFVEPAPVGLPVLAMAVHQASHQHGWCSSE